jgi:hypothetical protein
MTLLLKRSLLQQTAKDNQAPQALVEGEKIPEVVSYHTYLIHPHPRQKIEEPTLGNSKENVEQVSKQMKENVKGTSRKKSARKVCYSVNQTQLKIVTGKTYHSSKREREGGISEEISTSLFFLPIPITDITHLKQKHEKSTENESRWVKGASRNEIDEV